MRVLVVGGGIGGLATALALAHRRVECLVLEQASELGEVGAGIQLSPNGVRVLQWLGLGPMLVSFCVEPRAHLFRDWRTGAVLLTLPLEPQVTAAFGAPYYHAHRADLLAAMVAALDPARVRLGARVKAVLQHADGVEAELDDGSVVRGDLLVGADGIHSVVRDQVFAPGSPRAPGYAAWRGILDAADAEALGVERYSYIWLGPLRSIVIYRISGGRKVNWVGIGPSPEAHSESWSATGTVAAALREYAGWHDQVTGLLARTETLFLTKLYDRDPLPSWTRGRIALLGDAAHAMLPYHAQGAVQSLEDAWVLAHCVAAGQGDLPAALRRYEQLRHDRATQVQAHSRSAQDWYHYSDPADIARRNRRFERLAEHGEGAFSSQQAWLYAYDAEQAARGEDDRWQKMQWRGGSRDDQPT